MAKYFDDTTLTSLFDHSIAITENRNLAFGQHGVDLLDTDTLSSLRIWNIVKQYDPNYTINLARNGEDAKSGDMEIEQKCSKVSKPTKKAVFMFHAMANLWHDRYIFVVRDERTLEPLRLYDISQPAHTQLIQRQLENLKQMWIVRGKADERSMRYDVIQLKERLMSYIRWSSQFERGSWTVAVDRVFC